MSNKTDLQANNARIEAFIADGQDLPPALPDELGNATTADVLSGKTFTSDDGVMQTGGLAPNGFGSAIATDVLIGKTFSSATGIFQNGGLDPETLKNGKYVWEKNGGQSYVVSDDKSAYPEGGFVGDDYYDIVLEGIGVIEKFFGCTEYALSSFTFDSDTGAYNKMIEHSLGKVPKIIFVYSDSVGATETSSYVKYALIDNTLSVGSYFAFYVLQMNQLSDGHFSVVAEQGYSSKPTEIKFGIPTTVTYKGGALYTVIAMA